MGGLSCPSSTVGALPPSPPFMHYLQMQKCIKNHKTFLRHHLIGVRGNVRVRGQLGAPPHASNSTGCPRSSFPVGEEEEGEGAVPCPAPGLAPSCSQPRLTSLKRLQGKCFRLAPSSVRSVRLFWCRFRFSWREGEMPPLGGAGGV